jgi:hypothetical protein
MQGITSNMPICPPILDGNQPNYEVIAEVAVVPLAMPDVAKLTAQQEELKQQTRAEVAKLQMEFPDITIVEVCDGLGTIIMRGVETAMRVVQTRRQNFRFLHINEVPAQATAS